MDKSLHAGCLNPTPARAGVGLRSIHYRDVLARRPDLAWFEVHSENYFGEGGAPHGYLARIRESYALSFHGVGLSLGGSDALSGEHLRKLKWLIDRYQPMFVSEHLCWCAVQGRYLNELLPLPYSENALQHVAARISQVQDYLGRQILIENISAYLRFAASSIPEWEFLAALPALTGCALLLDVNNIYVNSINFGFDARGFIDAIPTGVVHEIHLAGFDDSGPCLIDTHGAPVADAVWDLYRLALTRFGRVPTLIEWDCDIPPLDVLLNEAGKAQGILDSTHACLV